MFYIFDKTWYKFCHTLGIYNCNDGKHWKIIQTSKWSLLNFVDDNVQDDFWHNDFCKPNEIACMRIWDDVLMKSIHCFGIFLNVHKKISNWDKLWHISCLCDFSKDLAICIMRNSQRAPKRDTFCLNHNGWYLYTKWWYHICNIGCLIAQIMSLKMDTNITS